MVGATATGTHAIPSAMTCGCRTTGSRSSPTIHPASFGSRCCFIVETGRGTPRLQLFRRSRARHGHRNDLRHRSRRLCHSLSPTGPGSLASGLDTVSRIFILACESGPTPPVRGAANSFNTACSAGLATRCSPFYIEGSGTRSGGSWRPISLARYRQTRHARLSTTQTLSYHALPWKRRDLVVVVW